MKRINKYFDYGIFKEKMMYFKGMLMKNNNTESRNVYANAKSLGS